MISSQENVEGADTTSHLVYHVNITFVAVGIAVSIAGVLAILPMYYGYWELGRKVSLNPLEIARAFGTPLFDGLDGNLRSEDVDLERGGVAVRYGVVERYGKEKILRIEETMYTSVRKPWQGEVLG